MYVLNDIANLLQQCHNSKSKKNSNIQIDSAIKIKLALN